jgi:hypothetical protein
MSPKLSIIFVIISIADVKNVLPDAKIGIYS